MSNEKLTDEEIIKALECCTTNGASCKDCPAFVKVDKSNCKKYFRGALDLINRQKSEIERLKECPKCIYEYDGEVTEYCVQGPCPNFKTVEQIKAKAYKEFAEKLENICEEIMAQEWNEKTAPISWSYAYEGFIDDIDNLSKEMVGEEK